MATATIPTAPPAFEWKRFPETEAAVESLIEEGLAGNAFAASLAARMKGETGTRFPDWVDHLVLSEREGLAKELARLGYARDLGAQAPHGGTYAHQGGMFPRIVVAGAGGPTV